LVLTKRERTLLGLQSNASNIYRGLIQRSLDMVIIEPKHEHSGKHGDRCENDQYLQQDKHGWGFDQTG
jgi:hypothetical protein